ncbi:hypothetical protein [Brevundimonas vesicularis]|uniref:hypothetical protein n=1 Tax=Brevundimonas vesicularis TaxID=41276 RepID=UPI0038D361F6
MKKTLVLMVGLAAAATLSACGRMADLEAPGAVKTERAIRDNLSEPLPEPATLNLPPSQLPIDGGPSDPFGRPPQ